MPRHQVSRAEASAPIVTMMYDLLFEDRDPVVEPGTATGTPGDWWSAFANVPDILEHAVQGFGIYQSPKRILDPVLRELGQARAGWTAGSQFVFSQHCKSLRALGVPDDKIEAVGYWPAASCFTELERLVLAFADCLVLDRGRVPDQLFTAIHDRLGDQATLELTYITSLYLQHA
jgi:alkylhydroperoxidase family enzyme